MSWDQFINSSLRGISIQKMVSFFLFNTTFDSFNFFLYRINQMKVIIILSFIQIKPSKKNMETNIISKRLVLQVIQYFRKCSCIYQIDNKILQLHKLRLWHLHKLRLCWIINYNDKILSMDKELDWLNKWKFGKWNIKKTKWWIN